MPGGVDRKQSASAPANEAGRVYAQTSTAYVIEIQVVKSQPIKFWSAIWHSIEHSPESVLIDRKSFYSSRLIRRVKFFAPSLVKPN
jgi:hypothetical protein